jgi:dynein heavy chain
VQRYKESIESLVDVMNDVKNKQPQKPEQFIILDCSKLKSSLTECGNAFIQDIFEHLITESKEDLNSLLTHFTETIEELKTPPTKLEHLKKNKDLYAEVRAKLPLLAARREPIKRKFQYIQENQDQDTGLAELGDDDKAKLDGLEDAWARFNEGLDEANVIIQKCYAQLKTEVDNSIEDFKKECQDNKKNFQLQAPYTADKGFDNAKAFEKLQEFKGHTAELRAQEEAMKFGLEIFDIEPMAYPEVALVEKEIAQLTDIWEVKNDWDKQWDAWKDIKFYDLPIEEMDDLAVDFQDKCRAFDRDVRDWGVYVSLKSNIDTVRATLPLILDLRDDAMRERHWKELRFEVKDDFDENSDEFTLDKVFSLGLLNHQEKIMALADNARRQLKIEVALEEIRHSWEEDPVTDLDIDKQKSKADQEEFFYIRSTDNVMQLIEDHGVKLSNMKSSPYYKEFDTKIDLWEGNIAQITETLEALLAVQGKWKYLESIFRGQPDISKQLPSEDSIFKRNNQIFKAEMERINKEKNCLRALIVKNFLALLLDLNKKFEQIQKNLNQFLEAKRGQFPRFYFLSNEDLLEIIGQSKDPTPILQHIGKMFEGVASLKINEVGGRNAKNYEIEALISAEKESVELLKPILVEAKVESWLKKLVSEMRDALRKIFWKYQHEHGAASKKQYEREKLMKVIKATQGQVLITAAQMAWTTEVGAALANMDSGAASAVGSLKKCRQNYKKKVESYVELVEKPGLPKLERLKLVALIIIDEHNREIIERLYQQRITSPRHFEWLQQLRFGKAVAAEENEKLYIAVEQTNCVFDYGYEYQGNNGRLVVTPLTDRAYMTLTNALNMQRGGAPQGPAGTGKTETVKDLGKNLAFFVVI